MRSFLPTIRQPLLLWTCFCKWITAISFFCVCSRYCFVTVILPFYWFQFVFTRISRIRGENVLQRLDMHSFPLGFWWRAVMWGICGFYQSSSMHTYVCVHILKERTVCVFVLRDSGGSWPTWRPLLSGLLEQTLKKTTVERLGRWGAPIAVDGVTFWAKEGGVKVGGEEWKAYKRESAMHYSLCRVDDLDYVLYVSPLPVPLARCFKPSYSHSAAIWFDWSTRDGVSVDLISPSMNRLIIFGKSNSCNTTMSL